VYNSFVKIKKLLFVVAVWGWSAGALAAAKKSPVCSVPGEAEDWRVANCFYQAETDDETSLAVQDCLSRPSESIRSTPCAQKKMWKKSICEKLHGPGAAPSRQCFDDKNFIPSRVQENIKQ
jgi:hypothetical protein